MNKWEALGVLMVLAFLNYMDRNLLNPMQSLIQHDLGIGEGALGLLGAGFHLVYMLSAPIIGYVADRATRKTILLVSLITWSIVTALSGTAVGFLSLLVWRSLTGLGEGGYFPTAISLIGDFFPTHQRGRAIALHGVCTTLGGSAGFGLGGWMGQVLGWRNAFFFAIVPGLILAAYVWFRFKEPARGGQGDLPQLDPHAAIPRGGGPPTRAAYWRTVTSVPVILISLAAAFGAFCMAGINQWLPKYLHDERGLDVATSGILTGAFFAATLIGQLSGGFLSDVLSKGRFGIRPLLAGLPYLVSVVFAAAITRVEPLAIALVAYGATQIARGFAEPNLYGTIIDAVPPLERGSAQGFLLMLTFAGSSAGQAVAGAIIESSGQHYGPAIDVLAVAAGISGLIALALAVYLKRRFASAAVPPPPREF